ncbi:lysine-rich arabinogalactan protein 19-like [Schistocerca piceifrons]|uniref:lysine-rich arabinogalactan protein 19-like n=1 Tax=Schistocerca piceifrons TaxID=274613 RepID=UPI001F5FA197|nr:lysine-rich arabinogalactan protein 19-like [Schistocerca piceifrons]
MRAGGGFPAAGAAVAAPLTPPPSQLSTRFSFVVQTTHLTLSAARRGPQLGPCRASRQRGWPTPLPLPPAPTAATCQPQLLATWPQLGPPVHAKTPPPPLLSPTRAPGALSAHRTPSHRTPTRATDGLPVAALPLGRGRKLHRSHTATHELLATPAPAPAPPPPNAALSSGRTNQIAQRQRPTRSSSAEKHLRKPPFHRGEADNPYTTAATKEKPRSFGSRTTDA